MILKREPKKSKRRAASQALRKGAHADESALDQYLQEVSRYDLITPQ